MKDYVLTLKKTVYPNILGYGCDTIPGIGKIQITNLTNFTNQFRALEKRGADTPVCHPNINQKSTAATTQNQKGFTGF